MIKYLSLDLQGTLSDSSFSDYYWIELLPRKYAEYFKITIEEAKKILKDKFKEYGVYSLLYYDDKYWSNYLNFDTARELIQNGIEVRINEKLYDFIKAIKLPKIIISTTTELFINLELKDKVKDFNRIYSCVDYFKTGGKTKEVYEKICKELNIKPNEMLHIGDNKLMDVDNARQAGINAVLYKGNDKEVIKEIKMYMGVR